LLGDGELYKEIAFATNVQRSSDKSFATIADVNVVEVGWKLALPARPGIALSERTTLEVLEHHLGAILTGDLDAVLADYADDAVVVWAEGVVRGDEALRAFFSGVITDVVPPGSYFWITQQIIEGEIAYYNWEAESPGLSMPFGTDTFIIRDGEIVIQTISGQTIPKE
jgi:hypothetical protein